MRSCEYAIAPSANQRRAIGRAAAKSRNCAFESVLRFSFRTGDATRERGAETDQPFIILPERGVRGETYSEHFHPKHKPRDNTIRQRRVSASTAVNTELL